MSNYRYTPSAKSVTDSTVTDLRKRILILIAMSTLVVAAAFGISFYFAFISSGSAVARQIPQLSPVVEKLKSQLLMNTFGLVAVIIASLFLLNRIIINRVFSNIGRIGKSMSEISDGMLPERAGIDPSEGFAVISSSYNVMLSSLRMKEAEELQQLELFTRLSESGKSEELQKELGVMIEKKRNALRSDKDEVDKSGESGKKNENGIFLQPS
ncbi:MAG: hypothetical protein GF417_01160 [Candidatus Latescibacteria bacterium]|nr:hypothetical protein [bacterium]MBD3423036.1 hypothetical protein [Candidatus Latescibacterota bacterium]